MKTVAYALLVVLVVLSLGLHGVWIYGLVALRQEAITTLDRGLEAIDAMQQETYTTSIRVQERIPVQANIPFHREMVTHATVDVPVSQETSIEEDFEVPIDTPLGSWSFSVPVRARIPVNLNIPVRAEVPVTISETIPVSTTVEIDATVPVAIKVDETPFLGYLVDLQSLLVGTRRRLLFGTQE